MAKRDFYQNETCCLLKLGIPGQDKTIYLILIGGEIRVDLPTFYPGGGVTKLPLPRFLREAKTMQTVYYKYKGYRK